MAGDNPSIVGVAVRDLGRRSAGTPARVPALNTRTHLCAAVLALSLFNGCGRVTNEFRGDTEGGRIQLDVETVENVGIEEVTDERLHPDLRAYERVLNTRLPVGAVLTLGVSVADFGTYRRGAGWINRGELRIGRHAVWATVVSVESSNPQSLIAQIDEQSANPSRNRVRLHARDPGTARISLTVQKLDATGRPTAGGPVVDAVTFAVK